MRFFLLAGLIWIGLGSTLSAKAQDLDVTEIVTASDAFMAQPSADTRAALMAALSAYQGDPTVQSVNAYVGLLLHDGQGDNSADLYQSAGAAKAHFEPVADVIPKQYIEARFLAAVALFNLEQDSEAMIEIAHVEGQARAFTDQTGAHPDWADSLKWKADAWGMAMEAYFESARERHPDESEIQDILASYGSDTAALNARAARSLDENGLPFCSGRMIQRPAVRYPSGKAMRGMFGAVILELEFDEEGQVINPRVLASVPVEEFDDRSLRAVGQWKFKPDQPKQVGVTCRLNRDSVVQPLVFQIR